MVVTVVTVCGGDGGDGVVVTVCVSVCDNGYGAPKQGKQRKGQMNKNLNLSVVVLELFPKATEYDLYEFQTGLKLLFRHNTCMNGV